MKYWQQQQVHNLQIKLIHVQSMGAGSDVATIRFAADSRAVPSYQVYSFHQRGQQVLFTGTPSGVSGRSYTDANWHITRSTHFVVYHSPYQLAGQDQQVIADLEHERTVFEHKFGLRVPSLIRYYLYPQQTLMRRMTDGTANPCGANPDNIGCTNPYLQPPSIQASEWPSYHEPIHVYQLAMEPRPRGKLNYVAPLFISEGTAVALENREVDPRLSDYCSVLTYVPLDDCARVAIGSVRPLTLLSDTGFRQVDAGDAYSLSGSFVKYLILRYGYKPFGRFYFVLAGQPKDRESDYDVAARLVYRSSIATLLDRWQKSLCSGGCG